MWDHIVMSVSIMDHPYLANAGEDGLLCSGLRVTALPREGAALALLLFCAGLCAVLSCALLVASKAAQA